MTSEIMVSELDEREPTKAEERMLSICPICSTNHGAWEVLNECDCGCGEAIVSGEEIVCSEGRHFLKECFKEMSEKGTVEEKKAEEKVKE